MYLHANIKYLSHCLIWALYLSKYFLFTTHLSSTLQSTPAPSPSPTFHSIPTLIIMKAIAHAIPLPFFILFSYKNYIHSPKPDQIPFLFKEFPISFIHSCIRLFMQSAHINWAPNSGDPDWSAAVMSVLTIED